MISGSESIDLYYLKYYIGRTSLNHSFESVRFPDINPNLNDTVSRQPSSVFDNSAFISSDTVAGAFNMLIVRLAIGLSLVGWRVKPDPGD